MNIAEMDKAREKIAPPAKMESMVIVLGYRLFQRRDVEYLDFRFAVIREILLRNLLLGQLAISESRTENVKFVKIGVFKKGPEEVIVCDKPADLK